MNKNKNFFAAVLIIVMAAFFASPLKAQVTIGAQTPPDNYSLLDLVTTNVKKGVHLPRLDTAGRDALIPATTADSAAAVGVAIYNTDTECFEVWNGQEWLSLCNNSAAVPAIAVQPREFSWMEMTTDTQFTGVTSPTDPTPLPSATISVTATGATSYQWYESMHNGQDKLITGANAATYTPDHSKLGMRQYYCVVSNAAGSVKSDIASVAVGCGALAMDNSWHTFMCYNLGATHQKMQQQMATTVSLYYSGNYNGTIPVDAAHGNATVYGDLYQWGRVPDGYQLRTSPNSPANGPYTGAYTGYTALWPAGGEQIPAGTANWSGYFIPNPSSGNVAGAYDWNNNPTGRNSFLWRPLSAANENDPCVHRFFGGTPVDGDVVGVVTWRIPTQQEWADIWSGGAAITNPAGASAASIANTWVWRPATPGTQNTTTNTPAGFEIKPDGVTTTLFLPAAGYRSYADGTLTNPGIQGSYWSSTAYGNSNFSNYLYFVSTTIVPPHFDRRADGNSIRCIAEM